MRGRAVLAVVAVFVLASMPYYALAAGNITMQVSGIIGNYTPGQQISGLLAVSYMDFIPRTAVMRVFINSNSIGEAGLYNFTSDEGEYSYVTKYFNYNLTSQGISEWFEYPSQAFSYRPKVNGTCGGTYCFNTTTNIDRCQCATTPACLDFSATQRYPCTWSLQLTGTAPASTVKRSDGLKFIYDATVSLSTPASANPGVLWSDTGNANPMVEVSMREACALGQYAGQGVWPDGWVKRRIFGSQLSAAQGTNYWHGNIEPFDNSSLGSDRSRFTSDPGGIYRDGVYQPFGGDSGAYWDGATGYVRIYNYNPGSEYTIKYLPPNGGRVCAYTADRRSNSSAWLASDPSIKPQCTQRYLSFKQPYSCAYTQADMNAFLPSTGCPFYVSPSECNKSVASYGIVKTYDPSGDVALSFNASNFTVQAYTASKEMATTYFFNMPFSIFPDLKAPAAAGRSTLEFRIVNNNATVGSGTFNISTCTDADGDGHCGRPEGGADCNDTRADIKPGVPEACNGLDDNCNGQSDEGFTMAGRLLGTTCILGNGGACTGQWVCTPDGANVTCNSPRLPGELREICGNGIDEDCDGVVDEPNECGCRVGETKDCGSNVGECKAGYRICMLGGSLGDCKDEKGPALETCNRKDDDCDGIVDNAGGGGSADVTKCGCYDGALPSAESCNGIDDNCDGIVDNGITCCKTGESRSCGMDKGGCVPGTEACKNDQWDGICVGGIQPGNILVDSDCNSIPACAQSEPIEGTCLCGNSTYMDGFCCGGMYSRTPCGNYNFSFWMIIAGAAMLAVIVFWLAAMRFVSA